MPFMKKQLMRIKLELQDLLGMLSVGELAFNKRLTGEYEALHRKLITIC